jgi:hypothetical protein
MTCIVGLAAKGEAYIGADSAGVDGNTKYTSVLKGNTKIFKRKGYVISGAGNLRQFSVLKGAFDPPKPPDKSDLLDFLNTEFVKRLRETLAAHNAKPSEYDGTVIFGVPSSWVPTSSSTSQAAATWLPGQDDSKPWACFMRPRRW